MHLVRSNRVETTQILHLYDLSVQSIIIGTEKQIDLGSRRTKYSPKKKATSFSKVLLPGDYKGCGFVICICLAVRILRIFIILIKLILKKLFIILNRILYAVEFDDF